MFWKARRSTFLDVLEDDMAWHKYAQCYLEFYTLVLGDANHMFVLVFSQSLSLWHFRLFREVSWPLAALVAVESLLTAAGVNPWPPSALP